MVKLQDSTEEIIPTKVLIFLGISFFLPAILTGLMKIWNEEIITYLLLGGFFLYSIVPLIFHTYQIPSKVFHGFYVFNGFIMLFLSPQVFVKLLIFIASSYLLSIFVNYKINYFKQCQNQIEVLQVQEKKLSQQLNQSNHQIWELNNTQQELLVINSSLRELATTDELTHLLNKRCFNDAFLAELSRAARNGQTFTFVLLEINHFLIFNENNHRKTGEELIKIIANILRDTLRLTDVISRYEWDLFALILTEADLDLANKIIQRIDKAVEKYPFAGREVLPGNKVTFSVGIANFPLDGFTMPDLIGKAEKALQD